MGIIGAHSFLSEHEVINRDQDIDLDTTFKETDMICLDLLGSFYMKTLSSCRLQKYELVGYHLKRVFGQYFKRIHILIDGRKSQQKKYAHERRQEEKDKKLDRVESKLNAVYTGEKRFSSYVKKSISKDLKACYSIKFQDKINLRNTLINMGFLCTIVSGEVDLECAKTSHLTVITKDGDFFFHSIDVVLILRPSRDGVTFSRVKHSDILSKLDLSDLKFKLLGILSGNDYSPNIPQLGIKRNYEMLK
jgi:hypothetical protein